MATAEDFGDYLLRTEKIDEDSYAKKKDLASMSHALSIQYFHKFLVLDSISFLQV